MEIVRNFINVRGLTPANELPNKINGQVIQHGDVETIYITEDNFSAKSIFQIIIQAQATSTRRVDTPIGTTLIIDGFKEFKILYSEDGDSSKARIAVIKVPYNTFAEIPDKDTEIDKISIYLLDGYFELLDSRRIYSYITYLVHIEYRSNNEKEEITKTHFCPEGNSSLREIKEKGFSLEKFYRNGEEISQLSKEAIDTEKNTNKIIKEEFESQSLIDIDSEYL